MVLPSRTLLDPRRDVDGERTHPPHDVGDALRPEPARDEESLRGEPVRRGGIEPHSRPTGDARDERVEEEIIDDVPARVRGDVDAGTRADRLDRPPRPAAAVVRLLVAVE